MNYNRIELADGIGFSTIVDEKFKTSSFYIKFITKLTAEAASANAIGFGTLTDSSSVYRSVSELSEKLSSLYGASLSSSSRKRGDVQVLTVASSWISDRYAFDGEEVGKEMLTIIRDCVFSPNAENGAFREDVFNITKKDIIDLIDSNVNNKRGYAISQAMKTAFRGEPASNYSYGSHEQAEAVTAESAYRAYREILRTAQVEIFYVSSEPNPEAAEMMRSCFAETERAPQKVVFRSPSPLKPEPESVRESFDTDQCKVILTLKTPSDDVYALNMVSIILGETAFSKLFLNVREKLSLCYYCSSSFSGSKNALIIDSGVDKSNIDRAVDEIQHQIQEICDGNISDDEITNSVRSIDNSIESIGDTPSSYVAWYFDRYCENDGLSPHEFVKKFRSVTKERITAAARSLKLDSIYCMLNKEEQE